MQNTAFAPRFRLSALDAIALAVGGTAALALATVVWWWGFVVAFVLGHFFLFCNVVRISRALELVWAGVFVALAAATITLDAPGWGVTAAVSLSVAAAVIAIEMRKPSYRGAGWRWINPGLAAGGRTRGVTPNRLEKR